MGVRGFFRGVGSKLWGWGRRAIPLKTARLAVPFSFPPAPLLFNIQNRPNRPKCGLAGFGDRESPCGRFR